MISKQALATLVKLYKVWAGDVGYLLAENNLLVQAENSVMELGREDTTG